MDLVLAALLLTVLKPKESDSNEVMLGGTEIYFRCFSQESKAFWCKYLLIFCFGGTRCLIKLFLGLPGVLETTGLQ